MVESISAADAAFAKLIEAAGGLDGFLTDYALILTADHAQTPVNRELPIIAELGRRWSVLPPSAENPKDAELAVSPTSRAAHVYLLDEAGTAPGFEEVDEALEAMEGVDLVAHLELDGKPIVRRAPGPPPAGAEAVVRRSGVELRFRPDGDAEDLRGGRWTLSGDPLTLDLEQDGGQLRSETYPDALGRLWACLAAPHCGDLVVSATLGYECVDWGDSLGPILFCGCGPESADEREQWALRDLAPIVIEHFGDRERATVATDWEGPGVGALG
jgi:hypothetical protein